MRYSSCPVESIDRRICLRSTRLQGAMLRIVGSSILHPFPNFDDRYRGYISLVHKSKADEDDISTASLTEADAPWEAGGAGDSVTGLEGFHMPGLLGQGGDSSKGDRRRAKSAGILQRYGNEVIFSKLLTLLGLRHATKI